MTASAARVLGVHPIEVTPFLLKRAFAVKYGPLTLSNAQKAAAENHIREELEAASLIEVVISNRDSQFKTDDFGQDGSDQAPYNEVFLSLDGSTIVSEGFDVPIGSEIRLAFFFHFLDPQLPLRTSYGEVKLPDPTPIPDRLAALIVYDPVS
jgi:hypothetical protein